MMRPASIKLPSNSVLEVALLTRIRPSLAPTDWSARNIPTSAFNAQRNPPAVAIQAVVGSATPTILLHAPLLTRSLFATVPSPLLLLMGPAPQDFSVMLPVRTCVFRQQRQIRSYVIRKIELK